ncbi:MAG: methyltransferase [Candidatus Eisenbacteria bacterium]
MLHSVQTGETAFDSIHGMGLFDYLRQSPEATEIFHANMTAMTVQEAQAVVAAYDFSNTRVLVDVGGGHRALANAILRAHPQLHALVFDQPSVIEGTRIRLESAGVLDRCAVRGGSFFDSVPAGGDTYTLKDILHDWDDDASLAILRNCRRSMSSSARLLVIERVIPVGNDPMIGKLIDIGMLVLTGGQERTEAEYRALLEAAGFRQSAIVAAGEGTSVVETIPV